MSDGRFALRRESRATGGEFELVVDDAYAGFGGAPRGHAVRGRDVHGLAAMALGLCDVVQAWAGGVRVESLFMDGARHAQTEGALNKAVSVLGAARREPRHGGGGVARARAAKAHPRAPRGGA